MANRRPLVNAAGVLAEITNSDSLLVPVVAALPAAGTKGATCVLSTDGHLYTDNGTIWVDNGGGGASTTTATALFTVAPMQLGYAFSTVTNAAISAASKVICTLIPNGDFDGDDLEDMRITATPSAGAIEFCISCDGPIVGDITVVYTY